MHMLGREGPVVYTCVLFQSDHRTDNALDRQVERGEGATVHRFLGL